VEENAMHSPRPFVIATLAALSAAQAVAPACGFIQTAPAENTLREEAGLSKFVAYGTAAARRPGLTTDLTVLEVFKPFPALAGKRFLRLAREVHVEDPTNRPRFLVFGDTHRGEFELYRAALVTPACVTYLKGLMALDAKDRQRRLRYCFDFLEHADPSVAADAFVEFLKSPDLDIARVAARLAPGRLRTWLRDPNTLRHRLRLYGFLLGNCGGKGDAPTPPTARSSGGSVIGQPRA
jgi:hypothetical protein